MAVFAVLASSVASAQGQLSIVYAFPPASAPNSPNGPLVEASDGNFYGTSVSGGSANLGTVFKVTPSGDLTVLHEFNLTGGVLPYTGLARGSDGNFYGTTTLGGVSNAGTFFRITPAGTYTVLHSFTQMEGQPRGSLIAAADGNFYVDMFSTTTFSASVFRMTPAGDVTRVANSFTLALQASDGNFYGFTDGSGTYLEGTIVRMTVAGTITMLHDFGAVGDGKSPRGLMQAADGNFYGVTARGGSADLGTVFRMTPAGVVSVVSSFTGATTGVRPYAAPLQASDGSLVGPATDPLSSADGAFRMAPDGTLALLHTFDAATEASGQSIVMGFLRAADAKLYGTSRSGGGVNRGTIFALSLAGDVDVLTAFPGDARGSDPVAIVRASDGKFYGTTARGGPPNLGTAFSLTADGSVNWLHSFSASEGPSWSPMIQASDGNLYGMLQGSVSSAGNAFRMTPGGTFTVLHQFDVSEAYLPNELVEGTDGNFYGTAVHGGDSFLGSFFRMAPDGTVAVLHSFTNGADDAFPGPLVAAGDGTFYGATAGGVGGAGPYSTVFHVAADGSITPLASIYSYDPTHPAYLFPRLTLASDGNLYGIVPKSDAGRTAIFRLTSAGAYTVLGQLGFDDSPAGAPVQAPDGNLYGLTSIGTLYKITPATGGFEIMSTSGGFGFVPRSLIWGGDGYLYGTASFGPTSEGGAVFRLQVPMPAPMVIDAPAPSQTLVQPFSLSGWALDLGPSPVPGPGVDAVHVWACPDAGGAPIFVGAASYGVSRPDVAAAFGDRYAHAGYQLNVSGLAPGAYRLVAFAHRTQSGTFDVARTVGVTIPPPQPWIVIDAPGADATVGPSFTISGWAIDTVAASGTGINTVHLYAYPESGAPMFLGVASYGLSRPDVGTIFGARFTNSGYTFNVPFLWLAAGRYQLVAFARSTVSGSFSAQTRAIAVRVGNPMMFVDAPVMNAVISQPFTIRGWAVDTDAPSSTGVGVIHVWAVSANGTPVFLGAAIYGISRPDVATYLGASRFTNSGYSLSATGLSPGVWQLVIFARSTVTGTFNQALVVSVTAN